MRILNEEGIELSKNELDFSLGYLKGDRIFIKSHPRVLGQSEQYHYKVDTFYFSDGSYMDIANEDDPHVKVIDAQTGQFDYVDQGEGFEFKGASVSKVIDQEYIEAQDSWDEFEDIQRFIPFTDQELKEKEEMRKRVEKQEKFLQEGPEMLEDLILAVAKMIGA